MTALTNQTTKLQAESLYKKLQQLAATHLWKFHKVRFYRYQWRVFRKVLIPLLQNMIVLTGKEITEEQINELESVMLNFEYTRQSGKTTSIVYTVEIIMIYVTRLFGVPIEIGIFAPQKEQATTDFKRLKNALSRSKQSLMVVDHDANQKAKEESNAKTIVLGNGSSCYIFPLTSTSKPESKTLHLILREEAQDGDDKIFNDDVMPMGASTNAVVVRVGTAGTRKCDFYRDIQKGRAYVMTYPEIAADRRRMYELTGDARHLVYERTVKSLIGQKGLNSVQVQKPFFNVWQLQGGMFIDTHQLIKNRINSVFDNPAGDTMFHEYLAWHQAAPRRSLPECDEWATQHGLTDEQYAKYRAWTEEDHFFGLDTAKSMDQTILKIGRYINGKRVIVRSVGGMRGTNYEDQFDQIMEELKWFRIGAGAIDSTGQGDFMPDKFERHSAYTIYRVKFSRLSKDVMYKSLENQLLNGGMQYYWQDPVATGVKMLQPGAHLTEQQQTAQAVEEFEDEFIDLTRRYVGEVMVVEHPDEEDAHDDHPDSTALMNFAFDSYNNSSGLKQFYENQIANERAAQIAAIAKANEGE